MTDPMSGKKDQFCLLVNEPELAEAAKRRSFQDVMLVTEDGLSGPELAELKSEWEAVFILFFENSPAVLKETVRDQLRLSGISVLDWTFPEDWERISEVPVSSLKEVCDSFPDQETVRRMLADYGLIRETDYTNRCGNCHEPLSARDRYCKYCGTKRGEGQFLPFDNGMYCIYGPPVTKKYSCTNCGNKWYTRCLGGGEDSLYCPQCGQSAVKKLETAYMNFGDISEEEDEE